MAAPLARSDSSLADPKYDGPDSEKQTRVHGDGDGDGDGDESDSQRAPPRLRWVRLLLGDATAAHDTKRALDSRHIMMIGASPPPRPRSLRRTHTSRNPAIGGTIGTGIFLSAGSVRPCSRLPLRYTRSHHLPRPSR